MWVSDVFRLLLPLTALVLEQTIYGALSASNGGSILVQVKWLL